MVTDAMTLSPLAETYVKTVREKAASDPMLIYQSTAHEVIETTLAILTDDKGVHIETALGLTAAVAGHACAEIGCAKRAAAGASFNPRDFESFAEIRTKSGERFVTGNWVNKWFVDDRLSFCQLVLAGAKEFGATDVPSLEDIARNTIQILGTEAFGTPRLPDAHRPALPPKELLIRFGPHIVPKLSLFSDAPEVAPISLGIAAQNLMARAKDIIAPDMAATILLECAFPTARMHPDDI